MILKTKQHLNSTTKMLIYAIYLTKETIDLKDFCTKICVTYI